MNRPLQLKDAFKGYTLDQDKIYSPAETVRRVKEKLQAVDLDILEGTARIDNGRLDIPIYFSLCGRDAEKIIGTKKQMGKGGTPQQSEASAVMELAERFSFFSFMKEPKNFILDTYNNLGQEALAFESIALSVHDESDDLDIAKEFFADIPLRWTWAYHLIRNKQVLIPFDWFYAINEFNGPSAGNCVEEALLQGICEVVERHVSSIICRSKLQTPAITIDSVTDPLARDMIAKYRRAGVRLYISDFSLDLGIPSVGVLAYDPVTFPEKSEIVWTAGTTPDPQKSLSRALTETAQLAGDFNTRSNYIASGLPKFSSLADAAFVTAAPHAVDLTGLPDISHDNIRVEVENCLAALSREGLEVFVVDTGHPALQIPAFYTIIPGAHFRERAAGTSVGLFSAKLMTEKYDPPAALEELKKFDQRIPGKYYVKFYLGSTHLALNQPGAALEFFEQALDLDPKEEEVAGIYSYIGLCLKELNQYKAAIASLEKGASYDNERTDVYNLMGYCYFKLKEHGKAIECFHKVLRLDPGSAIDYANIASNYRDIGAKEKAIHYYRLALELDPTIDFARENLQKLE
jgi:ribosomal protein S12 methylthiotransferase accessory factor